MCTCAACVWFTSTKTRVHSVIWVSCSLPNLWSLQGLPPPSKPSHTLHPAASLFPPLLSLGCHASCPQRTGLGPHALSPESLCSVALQAQWTHDSGVFLPPASKTAPTTMLRNICWISQWVKFILKFCYHDMFIILLFQRDHRFSKPVWEINLTAPWEKIT